MGQQLGDRGRSQHQSRLVDRLYDEIDVTPDGAIQIAGDAAGVGSDHRLSASQS